MSQTINCTKSIKKQIIIKILVEMKEECEVYLFWLKYTFSFYYDFILLVVYLKCFDNLFKGICHIQERPCEVNLLLWILNLFARQVDEFNEPSVIGSSSNCDYKDKILQK